LKTEKIAAGLIGLLIGVTFMGLMIYQLPTLRGSSVVQEPNSGGVVLKDLPKKYEVPKDLNTLISQLEELGIQHFQGRANMGEEVSYPLFLRMAYTSGFALYDEYYSKIARRTVRGAAPAPGDKQTVTEEIVIEEIEEIWVATLYDGVWFSCRLKTEASSG